MAKIDNMAYASLPTGLVSTVQNASNVTPQEAAQEASLLSALNDLRVAISAARGLMTGYSYKPLVGISTTIDPKGERTYYEYDAFGRLKSVRDRNGKLLSENDYHYRTQN
ncbi:RHS Repeat protein [compost metagenome]